MTHPPAANRTTSRPAVRREAFRRGPTPRAHAPRAYTLVEVLTTVAVLIIVLGLMVSLARHVRERAAVALTKDLLRRLDQLTAQYAANHGGHLPAVTPFPPPDGDAGPAEPKGDGRVARDPNPTPADRPARDPEKGSRPPRGPPDPAPPGPPRRGGPLYEAALANNMQFVAALKAETGLTGGPLRDMPVSMYDEQTLYDAWGSPIVFMPSMHPAVGTAPQDRFFFFSAGPDRSYLTQDDNLYSYEDVAVSR